MTSMDIFSFFGVVLPVLAQFDAVLFAIQMHRRYFGAFPTRF